LPEPDVVSGLLLFAQLVIVVALTVVVRVRLAREPKLGRPIRVFTDSGGIKPALLAVQLAFLLLAWAADPFPTLPASMALIGAAFLTWVSPGTNDQGLGEEGVFRGWYGLRYEAFQEWRLTGGHLRFLLRGEWASVEVPREKQAQVRGILERIVPEAESQFDA